MRDGDYRKAITEFTRAYTQADNRGFLSKSACSTKKKGNAGLNALFELALALSKVGDHVQAAERLSQVICLDETYDTAHAYRAGELSDIGLNTLALQDYNTAIRLNSSDMANYFNRAECYMRMRRWQMAVRDLTAYIGVYRRDPDALTLRGNAYAAAHKLKKAKQDYQLALKIDPRFKSARKGLQEIRTISAEALQSTARFKPQPSPKSGGKSVTFDTVRVRAHSRKLGTSSVPYTGNIALGLSNEHVDHDPIPLDEFERLRVRDRTPKDAFSPETPARRRMLLERSMGRSEFAKMYRKDSKKVDALRRSREDSVQNDRRHHPDYGSLYE